MEPETTEQLHIAGKRFYGQSQARSLISRSLATDRLAHGYLFRGPEGVGKQLLARAIAAAVNCHHSSGLQGCGACPSCIKFAAESHPDFVPVAPEKGVIKISQVRELIKLLTYDPYEAQVRVVLIEDVHTMRREAANSLLKTLEEPPENNLLILTADSAGSVLQTIVSRCQVVPFYGLSIPETVEILNRQDQEMDSETAQLLARLAEGSPGKALLFHRLNLVDTCHQLIALVTHQRAAEGSRVGKLLQMAEAMASLKAELPHLLGLIRLWLRDCLLGDLTAASGQWVVAARKDWNNTKYFAKLQAVDRAEKELGRNCNRTLVCEVLLFQLSS